MVWLWVCLVGKRPFSEGGFFELRVKDFFAAEPKLELVVKNNLNIH